MDLTQIQIEVLTIEALCQQYETRARITKEKLMHLERYVGTLEKITSDWNTFNYPQSRRKRKKRRNMRKWRMTIEDDAELALKRFSQNKESSLTECRPVVSLPQQSLQRSVVKNMERILEWFRSLPEKFGRVSTIGSLLYKELISTKRNDRNWRTRVEEMERVLRQLEAIGENVEQPTIETMIESKLLN
uniref:Uncharacterized protein n=1 Tax=Loa loa TaxID=7209 RepID=A0A1I7VNL3_LOALO